MMYLSDIVVALIQVYAAPVIVYIFLNILIDFVLRAFRGAA